MKKSSKLDPVTFEVLKNSFVNLVDQMAEVIFRTCYSFAIYARDFSSCLTDASGDTVAQGSGDIAVHVGTLHFTTKTCMEVIGKDNLYPGDVILFNDPYTGGTHFCDVRAVRPVFFEDELVAFTVCNGHWSDVGGSTPGSFDINASEHYGEGMRITPVKLVEKGVVNKPLLKMLTSNMRVSWEREGDFRAQVEATRIGEEYLHSLMKKYGKDIVLAAFRENMDYVERIMRSEVSKFKSGSYEAEDFLDKDPKKEEGLVRIHVKMNIKGDEVLYDLTKSDPPVNCFLNSTFSSSFSAVVAGTKTFFPHVPLNSGFYRVVKMKLPENSCVNAPEPFAATGFCSGSYEKIMNSVYNCWSQVMPDRALACGFNLEYFLMGGIDTRPGYENRQFIYYDYQTGGWGGRQGRDGVHLMPSFGVGLMNLPTEPIERINPVLIEDWNFLPDSAGPGKYRGGIGLVRKVHVYAGEKTRGSYCCDRERYPPYGLFGGLMAMPHGVIRNPDSKTPKYLGVTFSNVDLHVGDTLWRVSSGGGGLGDPLERDSKMVLDDVINGYVTVERARKDYGVVVKCVDEDLAHYEIDSSATQRERNRIREMRVAWLDENPEEICELVHHGKLTQLDALRQYGVVVDMQTMQALHNTTRQMREQLKKRAVPYWK